MDNTDKTCLVCHEAIEFYAIGKCDHPICFKCSTRMRGLCDQLYCPICRTDLPEVFFLTKREKFSEMPMRKFIQNRRLKIQFENESVRQKFEELLEHRCKLCPERYPDKSFKALQDHMRRVHTLFFCDLCLGLKIFSRERKYYNRQDLASHRRMGDKDDTSYKGHPLCQFCDERYLDKDELYKHLRKDHYFCHFCESLGSQDFFQEYNNLRDHFATDHFLCEEGECIEKQFEHAFRSEIDIKAHRAQYHSKAQSKFQSRQERTLNIDINLVPRPTNRGRGAVSREDYNEVRGEGGRRYNAGSRKNYSNKREKDDVDRAIQASLSTMTEESMKKDKKEKQPEKEEKNEYLNNIESFPTLNDSATTTATTTVVTATETSSLANKFAMSHNMSVQHGRLASVEDFPTLTKSSSGSDLTIHSKPAVNYQSLKSSQFSSKGVPPSKKTSPEQQLKQKKKGYSKSTAFSENVEDFPELPVAQKVRNKSAASSSWQSIGAETSPVPNNISFIREKPSQPEPKRVKVSKPKYDDTDFPSLGGPAATGSASQTKWFKPEKSSASTKVNVNVKEELPSDSTYSSDFKIIDRYSPVNIPDTSKNDKKTKGNKKKKKENANPREQVKRENAKNTMKENSSLDNIASLLMNSSSKSTEYTEKEEKTEIESKPSPKVEETPSQTKSKGKEYAIEKTMEKMHLYEEPQGKKQVDDKIAPVKFVKSDDDFPSLGSSKSGKKPPPGFKQETQKPAFKAPPGFSKQVSSNAPPGFVSQSVTSNSNTNTDTNEAQKLMPMSSNMVNFEYAQPDGFSQRNKELIGVIQSVCTYPKEFAEFKRFSGEFRRSDIGAQLYYEHCEDLLSKEKFAGIFPELLALLPDIPKQQELLTVYMMKNGMKKDDKVMKISGKQGGGKGAWKPSQSGFLTCITCKQVLVRKDYNAHVSLHNLDSDFPSLSTESSVDKNQLGSYGSRVKAK